MPELPATKNARKSMEAQQRVSLANLARQQAEIDQATSTGGRAGGRTRGRGLLTFLNIRPGGNAGIGAA